ncbi:MAG TPA: hypothetical protein VNV38_09455, partial [Stellaceae bacterium]|nr:hypothetical protein [Stellaceae bacterium]
MFLALRCGPDFALNGLLGMLSADCPRNTAHSIYDRPRDVEAAVIETEEPGAGDAPARTADTSYETRHHHMYGITLRGVVPAGCSGATQYFFPFTHSATYTGSIP